MPTQPKHFSAELAYSVDDVYLVLNHNYAERLSDDRFHSTALMPFNELGRQVVTVVRVEWGF